MRALAKKLEELRAWAEKTAQQKEEDALASKERSAASEEEKARAEADIITRAMQDAHDAESAANALAGAPAPAAADVS